MPQPQQCQIWASSATHTIAHHSLVCNNNRSLTHWARPGMEPETSRFPVRFISTVPWWELLSFPYSFVQMFLFILDTNPSSCTQKIPLLVPMLFLNFIYRVFCFVESNLFPFSIMDYAFWFFFFFFLAFGFWLLAFGFCPFRATPAAYGGSQARGLNGAIAARLHHSHSNTRSELHLWRTP